MRSSALWMGLALPALLAGLAGGCRREPAASPDRIAPNPSAPARYGVPSGATSGVALIQIPPERKAATNDSELLRTQFYVEQSELTPATRVHSATKYLGLFTGMTNHGLSAPTFVAWATPNGPRTFKRGEKLDVTRMDQSWVLVWWAGAEGWTNWDCPWVVYLQHKPDTMRLDEDGLHLDFPKEAGDVVLLPLYGYDKLSLQGRDYAAEHNLTGSKVKIKTWEWPNVITRDPLTRIRYWAAVTRALPFICDETFSVDRAHDTVVLRSRFKWRSIPDDWKTPPIKLAPISPPLAHAAKVGGFPMTFSKDRFDLDLATPFGPYVAVVVKENDEIEARLPLLHYLNETELIEPPGTNSVVAAALKSLHAAVANHLAAEPATANRASPQTPCERVIGEGWLAKSLPYLREPERTAATTSLRKYFHELVATNGFELREFPPRSGRKQFTLAASASCLDANGQPADPVRFNSHLIEALWAYAHFTDDWHLVKERWPLVKQLFAAPDRTSWAGFAQHSVSALGDQAAPSSGFARLAYKAGDMDSYHRGCAVFARELVHVFLKQRGADYFRQHQPWHSMDFMDEEVFLNQISDSGEGWQIDGPKYPAVASTRLFEERWTRFKDPDAARFYRDYLRDDVRRELNWQQRRWEPSRRGHNEPHALPSLVQLRSLLLNESSIDLAAIATPEQLTGPPAGIIASCLSILRASHPTRFERLIPPGEASAFAAIPVSQAAESNPALLTMVTVESSTGGTALAWPQLTWPAWKTPTGAPWTFGHIRPAPSGPPRAMGIIRDKTRTTTYQPSEGTQP